ncbi:MAG: tetratricopeptide repeat protein, partial [Acidobacteriota bacterium]
ASDVYALGVLLYGLLAGRLPFRVDERGYSELIQAICKRDPPKPSLVALSPPAAAVNEPTGTSASAGPTREPDPPPLAEAAATRRLRRQLAGDLDAIILKSLRKLPQERYGSATELAEDIRRHLEGLPVRARQGARLYRLRRTLRRNWLSLTVMGIVVSFAASSTILWRQAVRERTHAESQRVRAEQEQMRAVREQERAEEISSFLEDLFASADPEKMSQDPRVSEILEIGEARVLSDLGDKPELQAELLGTLGTVYQNLGQFDRARELKEAGLDRRRSSDPAPRAELAKDLNNLASLHYSQRDYAAAEARFRESLALWQQLELPAKDLAHLRNNLASALLQLARYDEAEGHLQQVLEAYREHFGAASSEVGTCLYSLATLYSNRGELEQAEPLLRRALAIQVELYGPSHPRVAGVLGSLGWLLYVKGELVEARDFLERVLAIRSSRLDAQHSRVVAAKKSLAAVLLEQGELETARRLLDEVLAVLRRSAAEGSWALADAESLWGVYLTRLARYAEAEPYLIESLVAIRGMRGDRSIDTRIATDRVVGLYEAWGRPDRADRYRAQATPGA